MHVFRILFLLALSLVSAHANYDFTNLSKANLLDGARYRLTFLRSEPDKNHGRMGLFSLRHTLDDPIKIWGFGFQKDGSLRVRFERFSKWEGNRWTEVRVGYCGTGAETYTIAPNRDYVLRVPLWPFAKTGARGVALLSGTPYSLISEEFDGEAVRAGAGKTSRPP